MLSALVAVILLAPQTGLANSADVVGNAEAELSAAKQAYLDARKNKSDLESAAFAYGEVVVLSPALKPNEKYPLALALFRQTLSINPNHEAAKEWEAQIVGIYASLGKEPGEFDLSSLK